MTPRSYIKSDMHLHKYIPANADGVNNNAFRNALPTINWKGRLDVSSGVALAFRGNLKHVIRKAVEFPDSAFSPDLDPFGNRDMFIIDTLTPPVIVKIDGDGMDRKVLHMCLPEEY